MTFEEKITMYKGKKKFIDNISKAFEATPRVSSVTSIEYEVYHKQITRDEQTFDHFAEYLVINFFGGGQSPMLVTGNSCTANFRVLGPRLDGGYYDEVENYRTLEERGFTKINLDGSKLDQLLEKPMTHISDVRACFNYCRNSEDVERVIDMIPTVFGQFEVDYTDSDEDGTFVITNEWWTDDGPESETAEYEFYCEE